MALSVQGLAVNDCMVRLGQAFKTGNQQTTGFPDAKFSRKIPCHVYRGFFARSNLGGRTIFAALESPLSLDERDKRGVIHFLYAVRENPVLESRCACRKWLGKDRSKIGSATVPGQHVTGYGWVPSSHRFIKPRKECCFSARGKRVRRLRHA